MNAGELVVSLILNVNRFKAQLQDTQREFDTVQSHIVQAQVSQRHLRRVPLLSLRSARPRGMQVVTYRTRRKEGLPTSAISERPPVMRGENSRMQAKEGNMSLMTLGRLLGMPEGNSNALRIGEVTGSSVCGEPLRKSWGLSAVSHF